MAGQRAAVCSAAHTPLRVAGIPQPLAAERRHAGRLRWFVRRPRTPGAPAAVLDLQSFNVRRGSRLGPYERAAHRPIRRRDGDVYVTDTTGWDSWYPSQLHARSLPSPSSPVRCSERAILVSLPDGMTAAAFDQAFDAETRLGAVDRWLLSEEGRGHCAALGIKPQIGQRLTAYPGGTEARLSPAGEIVAFNYRYSGPDRAIALIERIILRHLGLIQ